ncbi:MAG: hypothetical protein QME42_09940 [bacterium]|nr:hypothetical protein [bacterium]
MVQTLVQIQKLEKYIQNYGEDKIISMTLFKLFDYKIQTYNKHIRELTLSMKEYEEKHHMSSNDFYQAFKAGRIGDAIDFVDWASMYQMLNRIIERKRLLEGK